MTARVFGVVLFVCMCLLATAAGAHPMDTQNAAFVQGVDGPAPAPFMYLGRSIPMVLGETQPSEV